MLIRHILVRTLFLLLLLLVPATSIIFAQESSITWDENTKSWISTPTPKPPTPPLAVQPTPTQTVIQQPVPVVTAGQSTVDLGTLATVITPILAGIAGIFIKNRKDMEKKDEEVKQETIKAIEAAIIPKLKQITPVAEQTAKQSVQLNSLAEELYKVMADKANEIHDKPEIQQQKLIEDVVRSKMIAEQAKQSESSITWDENTKSWVSK